ncbi:hypothetical protein [Spiroplasma endosymbiont of Monopis laevigella]|uniref:hypothetical protein n=1 Tax=Spiroplasma endosymbiont of Monopis laevigella TaxID=3066312 RepID=UPI0030CE507D
MKKIILNPNICADEIELTIKKQGWEIIDKKYDFYQPYVSIFDNLNYEAKVDLYIAFKTAGNFVHKVYCYFLEFDTNNILKYQKLNHQNILRDKWQHELLILSIIKLLVI